MKAASVSRGGATGLNEPTEAKRWEKGMINESSFNIYRNRTDYEDRNGRIRSGTRWIVRDGDGERLPRTFSTRKAAVEHVQANFGQDANIRFGSSA